MFPCGLTWKTICTSLETLKHLDDTLAKLLAKVVKPNSQFHRQRQKHNPPHHHERSVKNLTAHTSPYVLELGMLSY